MLNFYVILKCNRKLFGLENDQDDIFDRHGIKAMDWEEIVSPRLSNFS